jgi:hypothetical protein
MNLMNVKVNLKAYNNKKITVKIMLFEHVRLITETKTLNPLINDIICPRRDSTESVNSNKYRAAIMEVNQH